MKVETAKSKVYSESLEDKSIEFHGHGGPLMIIGLKMGVTALNRLNAFGWFDLNCKVFLNWVPPDSCVIDGIQVSAGCTMGKHNIVVVEQPGVMAEFTKEDKFIQLKLKDEVLEDIRSLLKHNDETVKNYMKKLASFKYSELFHIKM